MPRLLASPVVIATHNPGKLAEMRDLLAPYGIEAQSAGELGLSEPEETGKSFAANARIKARAAAKATGHAAFADDSGLVVDALGGEPGIHSARWAGPAKDFRGAMNRIQTLLIERGAHTPEQRRAHFVAALCLAWPDGETEDFEGRVDGVVVWPPRGEKGFGYDPLFRPDGFDITFGEMSAEEKHSLPPKGQGLSHRARAFVKLAQTCLRPRASDATQPEIKVKYCATPGKSPLARPKIRYNFKYLCAANLPTRWLCGRRRA